MVGVHGNGLTHLLLMPPTRRSTVVEIFSPGGFAHDYEWTARALGHAHFALWNDTCVRFSGACACGTVELTRVVVGRAMSWPDMPWVVYNDGFHGTEIPVHAPTVVKIIEHRVDGS